MHIRFISADRGSSWRCRVPVNPGCMPTMTAPWNRLLRPKPLILAAVLASLACLVALALNREAGIGSLPTTPQRTAEPRRPALTAAAEQYIRELGPVHGHVDAS